ncbi:hypothetical protein LOC67_23370 [Stieleria sp. JC731]|uniref:hypothetical protein n=1 Tax=Pirellulaceae TaxID=2691357 RepID=UPI001E43C409|nr:hypothetical protein [Stieleria sp. JC731]MCC9603500.1 hypothetical protein [Stieleria sp. JC731]
MDPVQIVSRSIGYGQPAASSVVDRMTETDVASMVDLHAAGKSVRDLITAALSGPKPRVEKGANKPRRRRKNTETTNV